MATRGLLVGVLLLSSVGRGVAAAPQAEGASEAARTRVVVFRAPGFPTVDAPAISDATLGAALAGLPADTADSSEALGGKLTTGAAVLLLTYGSAFPADAWPAIRDFVRDGGGLVVLGGAPFHQPVRRSGEAYVLGSRQPTYARELLIGPAQEIDVSSFAGPRTSVVLEGTGWTGPLPEPRHTWALTIRLASVKDLPGEDGSTGPRDGVVRPLVHVRDGQGLARACPLLEIDRDRARQVRRCLRPEPGRDRLAALTRRAPAPDAGSACLTSTVATKQRRSPPAARPPT